MCLSHKLATNRSRDDRSGVELEIAVRGVVPSAFYECKMRDRDDGVPKRVVEVFPSSSL